VAALLARGMVRGMAHAPSDNMDGRKAANPGTPKRGADTVRPHPT
jgi:hypothetical protein